MDGEQVDKEQTKYIGILGHLFFSSYLVFCIIFVRERFLAFDAAFYSFELLNLETFHQNNSRYICYLTQLFAVIAIKLDCSMRIVLLMYSVAFAFWYYLMFLFVRYVLKDIKGIMLLIFTLCLATRYKHYAGHTEVVIAGMFAALLFIWVTSDKAKLSWYKEWMYWVGLIVLCFILYFIHPIIVVPLMMILGADLIWRSAWLDLKKYMTIAIVGLTFIMRFGTLNQYENGRVDSIFSIQEVLFEPDKFTRIYEIMKMYIFEEYCVLFFIFILGLIELIRKKRLLLGVYFVICIFVLLLLNLLSHSYLNANVYIMIDGYMGMLGMVVGLGIIYSFAHNLHKLSFAVGSFILISLSCYQIQQKHKFFKARLNSIEQTFALNEDAKKLYIDSALFDWDIMWYPYVLGVESLLQTCLEGKSNCKTLYVGPASQIVDKTHTVHDTIQLYDRVNTKLNDKYFKWPDQRYTVTEKIGW